VGEVLERLVRRMERHLRRNGLLRTFEDGAEADREDDPEGNLAASAVFGQAPPAGPQWVSRLAPLEPQALAYDKPLCASLDGFTLHAATRAGALDPTGREALLRYVLRPPVAQERVDQRPEGLVRITLKKAYTDGTIAVDMDPLSLLCRLATSVPPPRFHTVKYAGVLAPASPWRSHLAPQPPKPPPRATSQIGRITRGATARGRSFWRVASRWTSSPAPGATGG
jgi:Putative transposase